MEATTVAFYTDEDFNKLASPSNTNGHLPHKIFDTRINVL
jgi:hypothetical protein